MAGQVVSLRWPADLVSQIDAVCPRGERSPFLAEAARAKLAGTDPVAQLQAISAAVVAALDGCTPEERRAVKAAVRPIVDALNRT